MIIHHSKILHLTTITCPNIDISRHILAIRIRTSNNGRREYIDLTVNFPELVRPQTNKS
jgi:hypothetical protein